MSRYSPTKGKNLVYVAMIAAGAWYLLRKKPAAPVNGLGWGFSSVTNFARKVSKIDPGTRLVKKGVQTTGKIVDKTPAGKLVKRSPLSPLIARVNPNKPTSHPVAKLGQKIIYQDASGHEITRAQYGAMQTEYNRRIAQSQKNGKQPIRTMQVVPKSSGSGRSFADPNTSDWDGGDAGPSQDGGSYPGLVPESQAASADEQSAGSKQEVMPTAADAAQPAADAPKKINPLVTIGAFAAVPVILGLVGNK